VVLGNLLPSSSEGASQPRASLSSSSARHRDGSTGQITDNRRGRGSRHAGSRDASRTPFARGGRRGPLIRRCPAGASTTHSLWSSGRGNSGTHRSEAGCPLCPFEATRRLCCKQLPRDLPVTCSNFIRPRIRRGPISSLCLWSTRKGSCRSRRGVPTCPPPRRQCFCWLIPRSSVSDHRQARPPVVGTRLLTPRRALHVRDWLTGAVADGRGWSRIFSGLTDGLWRAGVYSF